MQTQTQSPASLHGTGSAGGEGTFLVEALWSFPGEQDGDLAFKEGDVIEVTNKGPKGWWTGRLKDDPSQSGSFPWNLVSLVDAESDAPAISPSRNKVVSLVTADTLQAVHVVDILVSYSASPTGGGASQGDVTFCLEAITNKKHTVSKSASALRDLFRALQSMPGADFPSRLPSLQPPRDRTQLPTWRNLLREQLYDFFRRCCEQTSMAALLLTWLLPGARVELQEDTAREEEEEEEDGEGNVDDDEEEEEEEGEGEGEGDSEGTDADDAAEPGDRPDRGEDPLADIQPGRTSVRSMAFSGRNRALAKDDEQTTAAFAETLDSAGVSEGFEGCQQHVTILKRPSNFDVGARRPFSLPSLEAFEDLLQHGMWVEGHENQTEQLVTAAKAGTAGDNPRPGDRVRAGYEVWVWDGSTCEAVLVDKLQEVELTVEGTCDHIPTPPGMHLALQLLKEGENVTVLLTPEMGFAEDGLRPHIPPYAHLVVDVKLFSVVQRAVTASAAPAATAAAAAPSEASEAQEAPAPSGAGEDPLERLAKDMERQQPGRDSSGSSSSGGTGGSSRFSLMRSVRDRYSAYVGDVRCRSSLAPHSGRQERMSLQLSLEGAKEPSPRSAPAAQSPPPREHERSSSVPGYSREEAEKAMQQLLSSMAESGGNETKEKKGKSKSDGGHRRKGSFRQFFQKGWQSMKKSLSRKKGRRASCEELPPKPASAAVAAAENTSAGIGAPRPSQRSGGGAGGGEEGPKEVVPVPLVDHRNSLPALPDHIPLSLYRLQVKTGRRDATGLPPRKKEDTSASSAAAVTAAASPPKQASGGEDTQ